MCRLYGFLANASTKVECTLVRAQNALLSQSWSDERGLQNADGWGIASYDDGEPWVEKRDQAAYKDLGFSQTAEALYSRLVIAHVRQATLGGQSLQNTHPFSVGAWTFSHNGTLGGFSQLEEQLLVETPGFLRPRRLGTTDSELIFLWLLGQMVKREGDLQRPSEEPGSIAEVLSQGIAELAVRDESVGSSKTAKLNFLLTDGQSLWATRWGNSLFKLRREGVRDCEICGLCHIPDGRRDDYRAVVIASEPISSEAWKSVPDQSLVTVDRDLEVTLRSLAR
jgi:glutamine amidotransferase